MFDLYRSRGAAPDPALDPGGAVYETDRIRKWIVGGDLFLLAGVALGLAAYFASESSAKTIGTVLRFLGFAFIIFIVARVIALSSIGSRGGRKLSLSLDSRPPMDSKET